MTLAPRLDQRLATPGLLVSRIQSSVMAASFNTLLLVVLVSWAILTPGSSADSAGDYDLPGPGLAYGGIPYGSVSGRVAEYFSRGGAYRPAYKTAGAGRGFRYRNAVNYDFFSRDFD